MKINWFIIAVVAVLLIVLVVYLVIRNQKDKEDVIESLNEPEMDDEDDSL